jgi:cob(I)alamin adenosyltransferase
LSVYTRRGDRGETDLFGGPRVPKDHRRVEAYGGVDELNAAIGVAASVTTHDDLRAILVETQGLLFDIGGYLATPDPSRRKGSRVPEVGAEDVSALEGRIDAFEEELEPLKRFILPGGTPASAALHVARTVCRRAERGCVRLHREEPLSDVSLRYLNRLSDLLFVMARVENRRAGVPDIEWEGRR